MAMKYKSTKKKALLELAN